MKKRRRVLSRRTPPMSEANLGMQTHASCSHALEHTALCDVLVTRMLCSRALVSATHVACIAVAYASEIRAAVGRCTVAQEADARSKQPSLMQTRALDALTATLVVVPRHRPKLHHSFAGASAHLLLPMASNTCGLAP